MTGEGLSGFEAALACVQEEMGGVLSAHLPREDHPLGSAMRHAVLTGGKRLRSFLLLESARALSVAGRDEARRDEVLRAAVAIEYVHAYSLAHDDLPAMDDGRMRHGYPSLHVLFGEAQAILAGDALLTRGFEIIPRGLAGILARGASDMLAGQARDMKASDARGGGGAGDMDEGGLIEVHRLKTGALMSAACEMGAVLAGADEGVCELLRLFGLDLGVAFQLADDLLPSGDKRALRQDGPSARFLGESRGWGLALSFIESAKGHLEGIEAPLLLGAADFAIQREK